MTAIKLFTPESNWFSLYVSADWQHVFEDGIHTFTDAENDDWAFQISAYKSSNLLEVNFDIHAELSNEQLDHPEAEIISLENHQAIHYTTENEGFTLRHWVIEERKCKALLTFITSFAAVNEALPNVESSINSLILK